MIFKKKYLVIKKVITKDMADFIYGYFSMKRRVARKFLDDRYISPFETGWGGWMDEQIPNTYSHYADMVMETLLEKVKPRMEKETKLKQNQQEFSSEVCFACLMFDCIVLFLLLVCLCLFLLVILCGILWDTKRDSM